MGGFTERLRDECLLYEYTERDRDRERLVSLLSSSHSSWTSHVK